MPSKKFWLKLIKFFLWLVIVFSLLYSLEELVHGDAFEELIALFVPLISAYVLGLLHQRAE